MKTKKFLSLIGLLVISLLFLTLPISTGSKVEARTPQPPLSLIENNDKLIEVAGRLLKAYDKLVYELGIPLAGWYVNSETRTIFIGLKEIKKEYTKPLLDIIGDLVNVEFWKAEFTLEELKTLKRKLEKKMEELNISILAVAQSINGLTIGLKNLEPKYMDNIRKVVGPRVYIEWIRGEIILDSKIARYRPVFGGIQIQTLAGLSTLSYGAVLTDGTTGFVMTGHAGGVGTAVYQPTIATDNLIGIISRNPAGPRYSDAAFVPTTDVKAGIYPGFIVVGTLSSDQTPEGVDVAMQGRTTCGTLGKISRTGVTVSHPIFGTLYNQVLATYRSASGDSGAPTYYFYRKVDWVHIYGTHWGRTGDLVYAIYSPIEGIKHDLNLKGVLVG